MEIKQDSKRAEELRSNAGIKSNTIRYEKDKEQPQIVYITLNRPEKINAIDIG